IANVSNYSFFEEAFFVNRSRDEPYELLYGDHEHYANLEGRFDHEQESGQASASTQRSSSLGPFVDPAFPPEDGLSAVENSFLPYFNHTSVAAQSPLTRTPEDAVLIPDSLKHSPDAGTSFKDMDRIVQDVAASLSDDITIGLDNPPHIQFLGVETHHHHHRVDSASTAHSPDIVNGASDLHGGINSQPSLEEMVPGN
ncbi:hypothetical protein QBC32DRAFT_190623, partial [Pseudoneurospora amorphoporcata]